MDLMNLLQAVQVISVESFEDESISAACEILNLLGEGDNAVLMVNSYGGDAYNYIRLRTAIDFAHSRGVVTFASCSGVAMSAGLFTFAACMNRIAGPYAQFLLHPVQTAFMGDMKEYRDDFKRKVKLNEQILAMFHQDIGSEAPVEDFIEECIEGKDQYLSASDGVAMGFVDSIGAIKFETTVNILQIGEEDLRQTKRLICDQRKALASVGDSEMTEEELDDTIKELRAELKKLRKKK